MQTWIFSNFDFIKLARIRPQICLLLLSYISVLFHLGVIEEKVSASMNLWAVESVVAGGPTTIPLTLGLILTFIAHY